MKTEHRIPFFLIVRHIRRSNRWTLCLVIFLMSIAFINLVFINSLFNGIVEASNQQTIDTLTGHINITPSEGSDYIDDSEAELAKIADTAGVKAASAHIFVPATLKYGNREGSWQIQAVDPEQEQRVTTISQHMLDGSYLDAEATDQIILGRQLAGGPDVEMNSTSLKGAVVGDKVTLTIGADAHDFTIVGIFYTKFIWTDQLGFISRKALDGMAPSFHDKASSILVRLNHPDDQQVVMGRLEAEGVEGTINTWQESSGLMKSVIKSFVTVNALLTLVGFIIAAVTIFIIIYVDITHKRRQIGILRAIGIKGYLIRATYILQSLVYSLFGVLLGAVLYFAVIVPYFKVYPFKIPMADVSLAVDGTDFVLRIIAVVAVSLLSGLIPAILATRKNILDEITRD